MRSSKDGPQDIKNRKEPKANARKKQDSKEIFDDNWNNEQSLLNEQNEEHQQTLFNESSDEDEPSEQEQRLLNDIEQFEDEQKSDCYEKCKEQWKKTSLCKTIGCVAFGCGVLLIGYKKYQNWDRSLQVETKQWGKHKCWLNDQWWTCFLLEKQSDKYICGINYGGPETDTDKINEELTRKVSCNGRSWKGSWMTGAYEYTECSWERSYDMETHPKTYKDLKSKDKMKPETATRVKFTERKYKNVNIIHDEGTNRGICIDNLDGNFKCVKSEEWLYGNCQRSGSDFKCMGQAPSHYLFWCELDGVENNCWCINGEEEVPYHCLMSDDKNYGLPVGEQLECLQKQKHLMVCADKLSQADAQAIAHEITKCYEGSELRGRAKRCSNCKTSGPVSSIYCKFDWYQQQLAICSPNVRFDKDEVSAHKCEQIETEKMLCVHGDDEVSCECSKQPVGEEFLCGLLSDEMTWLKCKEKVSNLLKQCEEIFMDGQDFNKFITALRKGWAVDDADQQPGEDAGEAQSGCTFPWRCVIM